jgi:hypothetical protein
MGDRRALACCLLVLAVAAGLVLALSRSEQRRSGTNGVWVQSEAPLAPGSTACQRHELLPADTEAVQIPGTTRVAPIVTLSRGGRVLDRVRATLAPRAERIQAPIAPPPHDLANVELCLRFPAHAALLGGPTPPGVGALTVGGSVFQGSVPVTYVLHGRRAWWTYAPLVAARLGRGRGGWTAGWAAWLVAALALGSLALTGLIVWRTLVQDRPMRRLALTVGAVALLNAATWSFITPAFQVPDEVAHVAYVQSIGETGAPPRDPRSIVVSPEQTAAMADAGYGSLTAPTLHAAAWSAHQQRRLAADARRGLSRRATSYVGEGEPEPPLYYALEAIPYRAAHAATLLDRMMLMRLCSALLAGVTALLSFLFVRECLPARRWAWAVGGLGVAFAPMLGFVSGGVNPDALLFALSAASFLCLARAWRRGVTLRLALAVGALIGAGMLTKVNFYGLVPGTLLGFALAARRSGGAWDRRVLGLLASVVALGGLLFALGAGFEAAVWHRPFVVGRPAAAESHVGLWSHASYVWQVFLPRLPFQPPTSLTHPGYVQLFETVAGVYGWCVAWLSPWAYRLVAASLALVGLLAVRMLAAEPRELRWRRRELLGYATTAGVLLLLIGVSADLRRDILHIVQGRYLLPLLPLYGMLLALGARGAGERWGRAAGVAIVAGAVAWSLLGELTTIAFFYS